MVVLVGADHAGKSTALRALLQRGETVVSCDDALLPPAYAALASLRTSFDRNLAAGYPYSREFLLSALAVPMLYLRDEVARLRGDRRIFVDSYAYKVLAKCELRGLEVPSITDLWRRFPPPDLVLVLRASEDVLWERAGRGAHVNAFEVAGREVNRTSFLSFQRELVRVMERATQDVPRRTLDADQDVGDVVAQIDRALATAAPAGLAAGAL